MQKTTVLALAVAAAREIGPLDQMVLWDPVVDGAAYVAEQLGY